MRAGRETFAFLVAILTTLAVGRGATALDVITTAAGIGSQGSSGDGGAATAAQLSQPHRVAVDAAGNLYIADSGNYRIRKVDAATGIISTVAGTGAQGSSGDGGAATSAKLSQPKGVALDAAGNIYIADTANNKIRKVTVSTGVIDTVAGTGSPGSSGDGGAATSAKLKQPESVAVDAAGNIYIADTSNHTIRKVDASTGNIDTIAGTGQPGGTGDGGAATSAKMWFPVGVAVDAAGNVYIADSNNHKIRKVDASTGIISAVAGTGSPGSSGDGGAATAAKIKRSEGVTVDDAGNLYIADTGNHKIRKVDASTGIISTLAGTGSSGDTGDGGLATWARLDSPRSAIVNAAGILHIADGGNHKIRKIVMGDAPRIIQWREVPNPDGP